MKKKGLFMCRYYCYGIHLCEHNCIKNGSNYKCYVFSQAFVFTILKQSNQKETIVLANIDPVACCIIIGRDFIEHGLLSELR
jgi:hypothetical protein